MHAGLILVVKDKSRWVVPRCVVGQANDRLVCLSGIGNRYPVSIGQRFIKSLPKGFRHVRLLVVNRLDQDINLVGKYQVLLLLQEAPCTQQNVLPIYGAPPERLGKGRRFVAEKPRDQ